MMKISRLKELLSSEEHQEFTEKHLKENVSKLLFKYSRDLDKRLLLEQIAAKQVIRKKLPEFYQNKELIFPPKLNLEQASHQAIAQLKASMIPAGEKLADLSGGFGVDFRYIMTKFQSGLYLDANTDLVNLAQHNLPLLLPDKQLHFRHDTAESFLQKNDDAYDLIYLDPSRRDVHNKPVYQIEDYQPNVLEIKSGLLAKGERILIKMSPMISITEILKVIPEISEVWVLSYRNECKEVSFLLEKDIKYKEITYRCLNIERNKIQEVIVANDFDVNIGFSSVKGYLYLPNASILKAGVQDFVARDFKLEKLHINSNLYTSPLLDMGFPGRVFKVQHIDKAYSKFFRGKSLQVISRNFPDSPEKIGKKLKLKLKGASDFLVATKDQTGPIFVEAELVVPSLEDNGG